jgi:hypothetical protein
MYKFAGVAPKIDVVNKYYQLELLQIELMVQMSQDNTYNEMILKFISQLEDFKSKEDKFSYDFSKNLD